MEDRFYRQNITPPRFFRSTKNNQFQVIVEEEKDYALIECNIFEDNITPDMEVITEDEFNEKWNEAISIMESE